MNLENLGVQERDSQEVKQVEGGIIVGMRIVYDSLSDAAEDMVEAHNGDLPCSWSK